MFLQEHRNECGQPITPQKEVFQAQKLNEPSCPDASFYKLQGNWLSESYLASGCDLFQDPCALDSTIAYAYGGLTLNVKLPFSELTTAITSSWSIAGFWGA